MKSSVICCCLSTIVGGLDTIQTELSCVMGTRKRPKKQRMSPLNCIFGCVVLLSCWSLRFF